MVRLLDHVGIVGGEVGALRVAWERLGFAMTAPRPLLGRTTEGTAVPLGQWSCHAVLDGGYVELTAVDPGVASHHLDPWRRHGDGGWIVAFGAADADSARERCAHAGVPVTPAMTATRAIDYGARHGDAAFRWFMVQPANSPEALLCVVEHRTPELVFQPEVRRHPNGATALRSLAIVVAEPRSVVGRYERLLDVAAVPQAGGFVFARGDERVELVEPAAFEARWPGAMPAAGFGPAALEIAVRDPLDVADRLAAAGVASAQATGGVRIAPADAGGVAIAFVR